MPTYRDDVVVLRTYKLGEADRIVSLLTRQHGKVRAVVKGVRRTSSRFGARLEPFMVADVLLYQGKSLDIVQQADSLGTYGAVIAADYDLYAAANVMVETADRLHEAEANTSQYLLLVGGLRALAQGEHAARSVVDSYLLRAMALSGWSPALDDCARCSATGTHPWFSVQLGGVVCDTCAPAGSPRVNPDTAALLRALIQGEWGVIDAARPADASAASGLVAAFAQWHLERGIRSLSTVHG